MKAAVVYWSMTGNTEAMANAVAEGIAGAGGEAELIQASDFSAGDLGNYDAVAFGCPAMGAEVLEESEFEPMFESVEGSLGGKKIALFGSYDWGDGEWMRNWAERCGDAGAELACDPVICNLEPDDEGLANCRALGAALV
ncbi:MAG: flavodoxin [Mogibacterium sp.]|nr:flavodoxin [Mogibacterium sp.]